jgi:hypothetical protein
MESGEVAFLRLFLSEVSLLLLLLTDYVVESAQVVWFYQFVLQSVDCIRLVLDRVFVLSRVRQLHRDLLRLSVLLLLGLGLVDLVCLDRLGQTHFEIVPPIHFDVSSAQVTI